jgi:co-chaperonin GroES (HSP10)
MGDVRPLRDQILVERVTGHGIERVSAGGIVIPATTQGKIQTKDDQFRARVLAMGPDAERETSGDLHVGDEVLVHTWHEDGDRLYTGVTAMAKGQMFVKPNDIICAVTG